MVNSFATWKRPYYDQSPNQSITQRLNRAGEEAVRLLKSGLLGFMVKTTWRFLWTFLMKFRYI